MVVLPLSAKLLAVAFTEKDSLQFLQRLAELQHSGSVAQGGSALRERFETDFLEMVHTICTSYTIAHVCKFAPHHSVSLDFIDRSFCAKQGSQFRKDVFDKVERVYLLGLRASSSDLRRRFFALYHNSLPPTLFDRLKFIVCGQDWENLSGTFWLKQALVRCHSKLLSSC